ncbi:MAG TPA: hypothetical protein VKX17_12375 [Planctomycetota bacterium]|nr:hypothetical protein [Planctomycetota bacterium]
MTGREILNQQELHLPLVRTKDVDFRVFLKECFDKYLAVVQKTTGSDMLSSAIRSNVNTLRDECNLILNSIDASLCGHPHVAFQNFEKAMSLVNNNNWLPVLEQNSSATHNALRETRLYRARDCGNIPIDKRGIFHVPFEDRHKIAAHRFSLPGVPCLYLCGSLYTCWCELNWCPLEKMQIAAFWITPKMRFRILDFCHRPQFVNHYITSNNTEIEIHNMIWPIIACWPIIAACAVRVAEADAPFKVEYVVSQLLTQWVTSTASGFDGLGFFSTRVEKSVAHHHWLANYTFPAKEITTTGRCKKLCGLFEMTDPFSWTVLREIQLRRISENACDTFPVHVHPIVEVDYHNSGFGIVQTKLNQIAIDCRQSGNPDLVRIAP